MKNNSLYITGLRSTYARLQKDIDGGINLQRNFRNIVSQMMEVIRIIRSEKQMDEPVEILYELYRELNGFRKQIEARLFVN